MVSLSACVRVHAGLSLCVRACACYICILYTYVGGRVTTPMAAGAVLGAGATKRMGSKQYVNSISTDTVFFYRTTPIMLSDNARRFVTTLIG